MAADNSGGAARLRKGGRIAWMIVSALVVESAVFGLALLPAVLLWQWQLGLRITLPWARILVAAMSLVPAYIVFALGLMVLSALAMRVLGWRTPPNAELRIADLEGPLLTWVRYLLSAHVVRLFAGTLFRASPIWTFYHRLNGARLGRRVYINSLAVVDDNLLDFDDGVVIGANAHVSGHTVEAGVVRTGPVRLGRNVTIGIGSVIGIGVEIGPDTSVGALSVVPKHRSLEGGSVYAGVPVHRLTPPDVPAAP